MASPVAWVHHYGVLLPAFAFCLVSLLASEPGSGTSLRGAWLALAATFFLAANSLAMVNWLAGTPFNVVQSYLLFTAFGVLSLTRVLALRSWRRAAVAQIGANGEGAAGARSDAGAFAAPF